MRLLILRKRKKNFTNGLQVHVGNVSCTKVKFLKSQCTSFLNMNVYNVYKLTMNRICLIVLSCTNLSIKILTLFGSNLQHPIILVDPEGVGGPAGSGLPFLPINHVGLFLTWDQNLWTRIVDFQLFLMFQ